MKHLWLTATVCGAILAVGASPAFSQLPPIPDAVAPTPDPGPPVPHPNFDPPPTLTPTPAPMESHDPRMHLPEPAQPVAPHTSQPFTARKPLPGYHGAVVVPGENHGPTAWQPGRYSARRGRPYYYTTNGRQQPLYSVHETSGTPWAFDHSAYQYHFGPGYYRHSEGGSYRFPYYTYRAPWYFPGHPIYNRDTNRPW